MFLLGSAPIGRAHLGASLVCLMYRRSLCEAPGSQRGRKLQTPTFRYKREPRQACTPVCYDDVEYRFQTRKVCPLKNADSWNKWMMPRLTSLAQWGLPLALLSVTSSPAPSFAQGTLAQRLACAPDALRLCGASTPNADEITNCLREKTAELSDACRTMFESAIKQPPDASESPQAERSTPK